MYFFKISFGDKWNKVKCLMTIRKETMLFKMQIFMSRMKSEELIIFIYQIVMLVHRIVRSYLRQTNTVPPVANLLVFHVTVKLL